MQPLIGQYPCLDQNIQTQKENSKGKLENKRSDGVITFV